MIAVVLDCYPQDGEFLFIIREEHLELGLRDLLLSLRPQAKIVTTDQITAGPVETVLLASDSFDANSEILIADCDSYFVWEFSDVWQSMRDRGADAGVPVWPTDDPGCSFAKVDEEGWVQETREKDPFTSLATTGPYWWKEAADFFEVAERAVAARELHNGEFYVSPLFNHMIKSGRKVLSYPLPGFWPIGTPGHRESFQRRFEGEVSARG